MNKIFKNVLNLEDKSVLRHILLYLMKLVVVNKRMEITDSQLILYNLYFYLKQ